MVTKRSRICSAYCQEALRLLGSLIREERLVRHITAALLAERVGISRALLQRIEKGDPACSIGAAFEAAAVLGIELFESEKTNLSAQIQRSELTLRLLPRRVRPSGVLHDDF
ncbi:MAG: helix-turn-helix transcriptional regulator [Spirochaetota bacterium]